MINVLDFAMATGVNLGLVMLAVLLEKVLYSSYFIVFENIKAHLFTYHMLDSQG